MKKVFIILCFILIAIIFALNLFKVDTNPSFKKVSYFSRPVRLILSIEPSNVSVLDLADANSLTLTRLYDPSGIYSMPLFRYQYSPPHCVEVLEGGERFYVWNFKELYEYDKELNLLRCIDVNDFELDGDHSFFTQRYSTSDCLYLSVEPNDRSAKDISIVKWQLEKEPNEREIGPEAYTWSVDPNENKVVTFIFDSGIYDFNAGKYTKKMWESSLYASYMGDSKFILSDTFASDRYSKVRILDISTNADETITWGAEAQLGCDDYIYFKRGSTQLWRYDLKSENIERVYFTSFIKSGWTGICNRELVLSYDRTMLAFFYRIPSLLSNEKEKRGLVIFDLVNKEYIELTSKDFCGFFPDIYNSGVSFIDGYLEEEKSEDFWFIVDMDFLID